MHMKRILSLLLSVAMLTGMLVMPASALTAVTEDTTVCPHCNTPWDDCGWTPWVTEDTVNTVPSGHYYLDEDLDITDRFLIGTKKGQGPELAEDVCIDLRGYHMTQTTSNTRALYVFDHSTLAIMDTVGGGQIIGTGRGDTGGTIHVRPQGTLQLFSGALVNAQKNRLTNGGVVYVDTEGNFEMYGGIVDGSQVTVKSDREKYGSTIYCAGNMIIEDGMVLGGSAALGGNIYIPATGSLKISGGTLMGGTSTASGTSLYNGGNIYNLGRLEITGGLITGGYAPAGRGGNIYSSGDAGQLYISGGVIENGQADSSGGNITAYGGIFEITGGTIRGNAYAKTDLTISGAPVIDLYGYEGLTIAEGTVLTCKDLTQDARIVLNGTGAMTEAASSPDVAEYLEKGYLIPTSRYGLKVTDGVLTGSVDNNGYCPHCQKEVTWEKYTSQTNTSGHYYTTTSTDLPEGSAGLTIASGVDIVLNLISGTKVTVATGYQVAGTLSILSSLSSAKRVYTTAATTDASGATFHVTGTLNLYDGVFGPAANTDTVTTGNGGVIYVNKGKCNVYGGLITGASAAAGGAVAIKGTSASKPAQFHMYNGVIRDGVATGGGGNIIMEYTKATIDGGLILNGKANSTGNIYNNGGTTLDIYGGIIAGGVATETGGNLRHSATSSYTNMYGGVLYGGNAKEGGNAYINNGIFRMYGGTMIGGVANTGAGGNLFAQAGKFYIDKGTDVDKNYVYIGDNDATDDIPAPQILGGRAKTRGGNVYVTGNLKLGKCGIIGGNADTDGSNLYLGPVAYMTVESGFDGELLMNIDSARITELENNRELRNTFCDTLNGKLYVKNYDMAMLVRSSTDTLALAEAAFVDNTTGALTWVADLQEAVNTCDSDHYVRVYAPQETITLTGSTVLDVNGTKLTVSGSGILYGFDSANDTYESYGSVTVTDPEVTVEDAFLAPNGNQYVTVTEDNICSFHRLGNTISYVSLRPSVSGMYYHGVWSFDSVLEEEINTFGIALSTKNMPGTDYATDPDTLHTTFSGDTFASGETLTSVLVENILKPGEDNQTRGQTEIYAAPYAVLKNGTTFMGVGVDYSLQNLLRAVDQHWPQYSENQKEAVKKMYNTDANTLSTWSLYNIQAYIEGKPSIRPLKVLSIGNSTDVDALHMLNLVAAAEGYDQQELLIGLLYYSGCKIAQHVNFLQNDQNAYALYISSTLTPDQPAARYPGYTMYEALKYEDWDIIFIHEDECAAHKESVFTNNNIQILTDYVNQHKRNPNAVLGYHIPWVCPSDPDLLATYPKTPNAYANYLAQYDNDRIKFYMAGVENVKKYVLTDEQYVYLVPSGTALHNAGTSYMPETELHRDYYHASDLGRVLVAYTWYCSLTGMDHLDAVSLDAIPMAFLRSTADKTQDRVLTEAEKQIILESVNNALASPLEVTQSQLTTEP